MVPQICPTGEICSCYHPLGELARSCNFGILLCLVDPGHHCASMPETFSYEVRTFLLGALHCGCSTAKLFGLQCYSIYWHSSHFTPTALFSQRSKPTSKLAGSRHTWNYSFPPTLSGHALSSWYPFCSKFSLEASIISAKGPLPGPLQPFLLLVIAPIKEQSSRVFPKIISPNENRWMWLLTKLFTSMAKSQLLPGCDPLRFFIRILALLCPEAFHLLFKV